MTGCGLAGISNLGNTCFMNGIMQSLISIPGFSNLMDNVEISSTVNQPLLIAMRKTFVELRSASTTCSTKFLMVLPLYFDSILNILLQHFPSCNFCTDIFRQQLFAFGGTMLWEHSKIPMNSWASCLTEYMGRVW